MRRITPSGIYARLPCSVVALGCAIGISDKKALLRLRSPKLHQNGYLRVSAMDALIRANMAVKRAHWYHRGMRPLLREYAHTHTESPAIVLVKGHYVYFDGRDYYSFHWNGGDEVICAWELK